MLVAREEAGEGPRGGQAVPRGGQAVPRGVQASRSGDTSGDLSGDASSEVDTSSVEEDKDELADPESLGEGEAQNTHGSLGDGKLQQYNWPQTSASLAETTSLGQRFLQPGWQPQTHKCVLQRASMPALVP